MSVSINLYRAGIGMWSLHDSRLKTPHVKSQTEHNGVFCINIILILLLLLSGDVHPNICGDYNIDSLKYECYEKSNDFVNQLSSYGFYPLIKSSTRVTGTTSTLIDNIYTNEIDIHIENGIINGQ